MEISFSKTQIKKVEADVLVVFVKDTKRRGVFGTLDKAMDGQLATLAAEEQFEAKKGQQLVLSTLGALSARRLVLLGLGEDLPTELGEWIKVFAKAYRAAKGFSTTSLALTLSSSSGALLTECEGAMLGAMLAHYRFDQYKTKDDPTTSIESLELILPSKSSTSLVESLESLKERTSFLVEGINTARDLVNEPPNVLYPVEMAARAEKMAKEVGLKCEILDEEKMREMGMNMFLAVGQGSAQPSRLIHLTYKPKGRRKKKKPVLALVGKGVTFDSGGLSLKPANFMLNMHADMGGAAAVFGAMRTIAQLKPSIEVHGYLAAAENMTGDAAYRVNDILHAYNGKTVEIHNTDAEGRLVLGDTLTYACENGADEVIDLATLTGACLVALGKETAAVMSNDDEMREAVEGAAKQAGESIWPLPLLEELRPTLKSPVADIKNIGGRYGGSITAALFLREFISDDVKWTHLDIAGPSFSDKDNDHIPKGGTGFGVATLVRYVLDRA